MNLCEYQTIARSTAIYLRIEDSRMLYPALGIVGECGEVAEKIKKLIRDDAGAMTPERSKAINKELGDCCWYLANICCDTGHDLDMIYAMVTRNSIHTLRQLSLHRLALMINRHANIVASALEKWYFECDGELRYRGKYMDIPHHMSDIIACIEEIAKRCGSTLESVYIANVENLSGRKDRGTLCGDGDNR